MLDLENLIKISVRPVRVHKELLGAMLGQCVLHSGFLCSVVAERMDGFGMLSTGGWWDYLQMAHLILHNYEPFELASNLQILIVNPQLEIGDCDQ